MTKMLNNFNNYKINKFKYYDGRNGNKICLEDEFGAKYMLKTSPVKNEKDENKYYTNGCISEHIGCLIYKSLGFKTQETKLGLYNINGKNKLCVLCKDFEINNKKLFKFAEIKNSIISSNENGFGVELSSVLEAIEEQSNIDPIKLKEFYFNMFIADAFLGNFDRHNGNWGLLLDDINKTSEIAPIYDCGSCLYPALDDEKIKEILINPEEIEARIYVFPNSILKINGQKINYFEYISSLENKDCNEALKRIGRKIDLDKINKIIDGIEEISDIRKEFYKTMLKLRKEKIIDYSLNLLSEKEGL